MNNGKENISSLTHAGLILTRIIATIGPASSDIGTIHDMIRAGMDIARLNLSHGTHHTHEEVFLRVRLASREIGKLVAVLIDIPGPKLRVGTLPLQYGKVEKGDSVVLSAHPKEREIGVYPAEYIPPVFPDDIVLIGDGAVTLQVVLGGEQIQGIVIGAGTIKEGAGVVIPGRRPDIPYVNKTLSQNLSFAAGLHPDFIALSFVGCADNIRDVRKYLTESGHNIPIIAKIETGLAVERFDEILEISDGIMVARGDLGVELSLACIPHIQKEIIKKCNRVGKPVITATEMLESMVHQSRPTRAEVTDVANAIADGTDATMLSAETSIGIDPMRAVLTMAEIAREMEKHLPYRQIINERGGCQGDTPEGIISYSACYLSNELAAKAIVAFTKSGFSAVMASRCHPKAPILALTPSEDVARRLLIRWGVIPCIHELILTPDELFNAAIKLTAEKNLTQSGDKVIIIAGDFAGVKRTTNMIKVQTIL